MTVAFYVTNILMLILLAVSAVRFAAKGTSLGDKDYQLRRKSFVGFFVLYALHTVTSFSIVHAHNVELYATMPVCSLYIASMVFMLMASAHFGRDYYKNVFVWFLLLQYGLMPFCVSIITHIRHYYEPIMSFDEIFASANPVFVYGKMFFYFIMFFAWCVMVVMVAESYLYSLRNQCYNATERNLRPQSCPESVSILLYTIVLTVRVVAYFTPYLWLHVACNVALMFCLLRSNHIFFCYAREVESMESENRTYREISQKVEKMLASEDGNPLYNNANIDAIAEELGVSRGELSDYIYKRLGTTFAAWVSEKKLLRCLDQIANTDRKISEIAYSTGYADLPAMSKAFKKRFGFTPSDYRRKTRLGSDTADT